MFFITWKYEMTLSKLHRVLASGFVAASLCLGSVSAFAEGGISIQGTRIVYPQGAKQVSVLLTNHSRTDTFLVQSWVDAASGGKTKDFVVTPPLYVSKPEDGNNLRVMYTGGELPKDRETLYYFIVKAIPSVDKKDTEGKNTLIMAAANRIKLFVRPAGLKPELHEAPAQLTFRRSGKTLEINNPGPYYLTLTELKAGSHKLENVMVSPKGKASIPLPAGSGSSVTFRTINDHGALTPALTKSIQ
ncbi:fimbria/pilus periplasmic chaperone [Klebsiella oxytoca]|uniref:fimbria/pilus periplasmic chaperone n=1 Tax=Klebsiella oxytoca TaxID=571 RepID=UPI002E16C973|nr:fimbria/pilus periplasmic chaperone [Klebsiella oxytoca]MEC5505026.1 fimbria/pilus periplasmic chaperone [Klebsiella oxytoca]